MVSTPGVSERDTASGQSRFWLTDALGSQRNLRDSAWDLTDDFRFDAFGNPFNRTGSDPAPLGFAATSGYQTDADSGLMLLGNRYYDPTIGRFLSEDPAGDGDNWYEYCGNDPIDYVDPTGLEPQGGGDDTTTYPDGTTVTVTGSFNQDGPIVNGVMNTGTSTITLSHSVGSTSDVGGPSGSWWDSVSTGVDNFATFGLAGKAGTAWGSVDGTNKSRTKAIGLTVAAIGAVGLAAVTRGEDSEISAESQLEAESLRYTETVADHLPHRPWMDSVLLRNEIMGAKPPIPDPGGVPGALRWDVPGAYLRGADKPTGTPPTEGTWELVIDPIKQLILHFNFVK